MLQIFAIFSIEFGADVSLLNTVTLSPRFGAMSVTSRVVMFILTLPTILTGLSLPAACKSNTPFPLREVSIPSKYPAGISPIVISCGAVNVQP